MESKNGIVGVFVVVGVVLFAVGLFLIGSRNQAFGKHVDYYTEFTNLSGLTDGAKVRVAGMEAGKIVSIAVPGSPASKFRLKLEVDKKLSGLVRTDSVVTIETEGVVGDSYLLVHPGSANDPAAQKDSTLPSKEALELSALLEKGNGLMTDADTTIKQLGGQLNSTLGQVKTTVANVNGVVGNVNDVVVGIKHGRGTVGMLLSNQQVAGQVQDAVTNAQQATVRLNHASGTADQMISDLQSRQLPQKADETMNNVRNASAQIDVSAQQLNKTLAEATAPDREGVDAGTNLRQTLENANVATANLAEDTEALKHEFFFRGMFKKQGYYHLSDLSAETYRSSKVFDNPANKRAWLGADALFTSRPDGSEQLTLQGQKALDDAVVQLGAAAVQGPLVVEGYSDSPDAAVRLALSRARAIAVRNYLQQHFQVDSDEIGYVALEQAPPAGAGRQSWNGVSLVLLKPR